MGAGNSVFGIVGSARSLEPPGGRAPLGICGPSALAAAAAQASPDQGTLDALAGLIEPADEDNQLLEELQCAICTHPSFQCPVETPCEHLFHRSCIDRCVAERGPSCPVCRAGLPGSGGYRAVSRAIRGMLSKTKVDCPQGCGAQLPFEQLDAHVYGDEGCPLTPIICGHGSCGSTDLRRDAGAHRDHCPHAVVPCGACGGEVRRGDLQSHRELVACPHCLAQGVHRCCMDAHLHGECAAAVPLHVVMQALREARRELGRQSAAAQDRILEEAGMRICAAAVPEPLGDTQGCASAAGPPSGPPSPSRTHTACTLGGESGGATADEGSSIDVVEQGDVRVEGLDRARTGSAVHCSLPKCSGRTFPSA